MENEKFMKAPSTHPFYEKCLKWHDEREKIFEQAVKYLKSYGVDSPNEIALVGNKIYVKDTPHFREVFKDKYSMEQGWLAIKRNNKIGKGWDAQLPWKPNIGWDLNIFEVLNFRECKFIVNNTLYAREASYGKIAIPDGFTEIQGSEFYTVAEKINKEKLDYIKI